MAKREMSRLELESAIETVARQVGNGPRSEVVGWIFFFIDQVVSAMRSPWEPRREALLDTWGCILDKAREKDMHC